MSYPFLPPPIIKYSSNDFEDRSSKSSIDDITMSLNDIVLSHFDDTAPSLTNVPIPASFFEDDEEAVAMAPAAAAAATGPPPPATPPPKDDVADMQLAGVSEGVQAVLESNPAPKKKIKLDGSKPEIPPLDDSQKEVAGILLGFGLQEATARTSTAAKRPFADINLVPRGRTYSEEVESDDEGSVSSWESDQADNSTRGGTYYASTPAPLSFRGAASVKSDLKMRTRQRYSPTSVVAVDGYIFSTPGPDAKKARAD